MTFENDIAFAQRMDQEDPLRSFRDRFHLPLNSNGTPYIYFCGNSLGLQPTQTKSYIEEELEDWARLGVEGHIHGRHPWLPYHEFLTEKMAAVVGGLPSEVIVMNTLSVNLHIMMASFYRPTTKRNKILVEYSPFPSDRYAVESQIRFHGFDPSECLIELRPEEGTEYVSRDHIHETLETHGEEIALVLIGSVNYYTGQAYPLKAITEAAHAKGCKVGFDLAHGAGNLKLTLHDDGPDFACWCSYKYLNSGPGSLSGCFIHQRHHHDPDIKRFHGWWGHNKEERFKMGDTFMPINTAETWQLSNPPILSMAAIRASLDIFAEAGMTALSDKASTMTAYLEFLLMELKSQKINIITPSNPGERGCQLSIQIIDADKSIFDNLTSKGVIADWREPDVIRIAPVPLYNTYKEVLTFCQLLNNCLNE